MANTSVNRSRTVVAAAFGSGAPVVVGQLCRVTASGAPLVDYPGNDGGPLPARIVGAFALADALPGVALALAFDGGDKSRPLILGLVSDQVAESVRPPLDVIVNGETVQVQAQRELSLNCGQASIVLRHDGKIIIKGVDVVSRASGANKIKGGLVNIN